MQRIIYLAHVEYKSTLFGMREAKEKRIQSSLHFPGTCLQIVCKKQKAAEATFVSD